MKFLDLFAGIGGFRLGLEKAGHECVGFCEIDKFARQSYKAIHNTEGELELHDITAVTDEQWAKLRGTVDIISGGFPCQAFSIAGKRRGFEDTRGTLFFEIARAAKQIQPRYLFLENVKGLLSHDKGQTFAAILTALDELGYDAEWGVVNSKAYVPQNRERVFIIGHSRNRRGREVFPITGENTGVIDVVNKNLGMPRETERVYKTNGISPTLNTMQGGQREPKILVNVNPSGNGMNGNVYDSNGLSPTLTTNKGEGPKIAVREATKKGYAIAEHGDSINFSNPNSKTRRGRVGKGIAQTLDTQCNQAVIVQKPRGFNQGGEHEIAPTLSSNGWQENNLLKVGGVYTNDSKSHNCGVLPGLSRTLKSQNHDAGVSDGQRIRKLTPRECWRLQGFPDSAFDKAREVNSDSQLYKQAGNSVTVPVIYEIARRL